MTSCKDKDLMKYLPYYYQNSAFVNDLQEALCYELELNSQDIQDFLDQFFIQTATWGLSIWEKELGLLINEKLSYKQRRERILAKLRGRGTTTKEMVKRAAESFSGGEVEVIEQNDKYHFIIYFIGSLGQPENMKDFRQMLENIKPAHLSYSFKFKYRTWGEISKYTWEDLESYTWEQVYSEGEIIGE